MDKDAPTEDYGTVEVEDTDEGMITILTTDNLNSPNGTLTTYDCGQATLPQSPTSEVFQQSNIPTSPAGPDWNATHADPSVFQAHRITTDVLNHLSDMNINFNNIHVASNCSSFNARLVGTTVNDNGYIAIGQDLFGSTFAEADIITHELGHHLFRSNELLDYTERSAPLQEGISDMLAVYVESLEQFGVPDWIIGNRVSVNIRDLESPVFDCYDDVDDFTIDDRHLRGAPLGHWYYLVASGALGGDIVELGPLVPLEVALEALNHIDQDSDYPELMEGTIQVALERFGRCSDEFIAIANAWEEICVPTGLPTDENGLISCEYSFDLPAFVCEEDDYLKVCLDNPSTGHHYTWTIIGKNSPQYVMNGTQTGNSTTGQNLTCLEITSFPSLPYYPQSITIQVYSPNLGASFLVKRLTMIVDCEHDDPTCDEYYESQGYSYIPNAGSTSDLEIVPPRSMSRYSTTEPEVSKLVNVYNILGQIIFSGTSDDVNNFLLSYIGVHGSQILFKVTYQQNGEVVDTEKIVFLGR